MKFTKKIKFAVIGACMALGLAAVAVACKPANTESPAKPATPEKPEVPDTYSVTYAFGGCDDVLYDGDSTLPTETPKKAGETFDLAAAPEWDGYDFLGWHDGAKLVTEDTYTMPAHAVTFTAQWEAPEAPATYSVTYAFGSCNGTNYAGTSALPTEPQKEAGETFNLAVAPVWENHSFLGWSDGTNTYAAGVQYAMSDEAVVLTAEWMEFVEDTDITVPVWAENATTGGYKILKGQFVKISAQITKETSDSAYGLAGKIFPDSVVDNYYFYQCRCDFVIKRTDWNWNEDNDGFTVDNGGWNRESYRESTEGDVEITAALDEDGVFTYTFKFTSASYSHTRVFTDNDKMDSAIVIFGLDHTTAENAKITYPAKDVVRVALDYGYGDKVGTRHLAYNSTYTFPTDPTRDEYTFRGWKLGGEGEAYKQGGTYTLGNTPVTFTADWLASVSYTYSLEGGKTIYGQPKIVYNEETGLYDITFPNTKSGKKDTLVFKCWEITVNGEPFVMTGPVVSVAPGSVVDIKATYGEGLTVTYANGSCEGINYNDAVTKPKNWTETPKPNGGMFELVDALTGWDGYEFLGWSDDGGTTIYPAHHWYTMPDHAVDFVAQWRKIPTHTVVFEGGECNGTPYAGQALIDQPDGPIYEGKVFNLARPLTWEGYKFLGWSCDGGETLYAGNYRYTMGEENLVFTAYWEKITDHPVTYLPGGEGVLNMPAEVEYSEGQLVKAIPVRNGYSFLGWSDGNGNVYVAGDKFPVTGESLTLTATWKALAEEELDENYAEYYTLLSGVWEFEDEHDMVYVVISGLSAAWDATLDSGAYAGGSITITGSVNDNGHAGVTFTINFNRPTGVATLPLTGTYYFDLDEIWMLYGFETEIFTRSDSTPKPEESDDAVSAAATQADAVVPTKQKEQ